ncbi:MAG: Ig-like domain-containing protein [Desulfamplus sp.]|nr:Ig-like domain-containing protein [Desulfamplus sp.]
MKKSLMVFIYWITLFAVTLSGSNVYSASKYESEPNDKTINANAVTFGDKIVGTMWHALDYDWYAVNVPYAGLVSLTAYYDFPTAATADTANLYVEVRDSYNKVLSEFFIDYKDYKINTPYIRDINIPSAGIYYIVAHCPSQTKFKRDRYYLTMARGGGENAKLSILNDEGSVSVVADEESTTTLTALVVDEDGHPVIGAPVVFSIAFGDTINIQNTEFVFSSKDISSSTGISNEDFFLFYGEKEMTFTYVNDEQYVYNEGGTLVTATYPSYFKAQLINATTGDKTFLFSTTEDNVTEKKVTKNINADANYYLEVEADHGIWEIIIPNKTASSVSNEIGTAATGSDGKAVYKYTSTNQKGDFTITASFGNSYDKLVINQIAGNPTKINILDLVDDPDNDPLYINREYTINVIVTDKNGNLVEDGTEIILASSTTGLKIDTLTAKTKSGMAKFVISATTAREYTLTASVVGNAAIKDTTTLNFNTITLSNIMAQPAYILADGKTPSTISVRLSNSKGLAVKDEPITFSTTCGTLLADTAKTDDNGIAQIQLIAPFTPGTCTVTASYGTAKLTTPVEFYGDGTGATTASILLEAENNTVSANGKSSVVLTATLTDNAGLPVAAGTPVTFTTDKGIFPNGTTTFKGATPTGGIIKVAILSQNGQTGKANITCSSGGISQSIQVTFTAVNVDGSPAGQSTAFIKLSAAPIAIPADGKSSLMISAELLDSTNKAVPAGTEIIFYAANGKFSNGLLEFTAATTDEAGKVYVALISSTTAGSVDVWCLSNGIYQLTTVTFTGGTSGVGVGTINLSANPTSILANGLSSTSITAELKDNLGNPVPSGTSVEFKTTLGTFSNKSTTITAKTSDASGKIIIPLISSTTAGYAQVTASAGGTTQSTLVTFEGGEQQAKTAYIDLEALPDKIPADGKTSLTITAMLYDSTGKAMPKGTAATFTTSSGSFSSGSTYTAYTADDSGKISVSLISSIASGSVDITCSSNNITQFIQVYFTGSNTGIGATNSIELTSSSPTLTADGASSATITITLKDSKNDPVVQGTSVTLTTTLGTLSKTNLTTVDDTGIISVSLKAGTEAGTARVVATSNGITQALTVIFTGGTSDSKTPTQLALALSQISVKTDNSDSTTITATVLDEKFAVIAGIPVSFSSDGGQLSSSLVETDDNGQAKVTFSSGTIDKSNRVVTVTADVPVLDPKTIPIQVSGSTLSLSSSGKGLILDDKATPTDESNSLELIITAKDAGGNPVYDTSISISAVTGKTGSIAWTPSAPYKTNINGEVTINVKGVSAGDAELNITGVGTTITQSYTVSVLSQSFGITAPASDLTQVTTGTATADGVTVTVRAPTQNTVKFATTMGGIGTATAHSDLQIKEVAVAGGVASVVVRSDLAGVATIEVSDKDDPTTVDRVTVAFVRPSGDAATIKLQSNTAVIAPSVGDNKSIAEFTAYVKTSGDTGNQAVAGVPVIFSIDNSTGSGENISPVIVYTNDAGEAKTTFTAGSLGSNAEGVTVNARVVGSATTGNLSGIISFTAPSTITRSSGSFITDGFKVNQQIKVVGSTVNDGYYTVKTVAATTLTLDNADNVNTTGAAGTNIIITALTHSTNIVIGGTSGSVVIGRGAGNSIVILNPTTYSLSMSVLVADLNGNPVSGANVSLALWPEFYSTGVWYDLNDRTSDHYVPYIIGSLINEDINENTFLDPGEDTNKDGILTPPNSAAGNIPTLLTTDKDGLAEFNIIYLKSSAVWIIARITATTMVFGTETKAEIGFTLPAEKTEAEAGYLPDSSYPYVLQCNSGSKASFRLPFFTCGDGSEQNTFTASRGTIVGVAGTGVDENSDGSIDYYKAYDYEYTDNAASTKGTTLYDTINVKSGICATSFRIKIIIQ